MLVIDANEEESVCRSGLPCCRSVTGVQHIRETLGRPFPSSHVNERTDDGPDHVFEKPIGIGFDGETVVPPTQGEPLKMASRVLVICEGTFKR